tara:strand:+ start:453 stop:671 length:219 start_codon:yes stop_codon:yes gene_type:complete
MSGLATPHRTTGDMGGLLSDGSDDDEVEGEVWDDEEEDWDDEDWDDEEDEEEDGVNPDDEPDLWMGDEEEDH